MATLEELHALATKVAATLHNSCPVSVQASTGLGPKTTTTLVVALYTEGLGTTPMTLGGEPSQEGIDKLYAELVDYCATQCKALAEKAELALKTLNALIVTGPTEPPPPPPEEPKKKTRKAEA